MKYTPELRKDLEELVCKDRLISPHRVKLLLDEIDRLESAVGSPTRMEPQPIVPASSHRSDENHDPEPEK